MRSLPQSSHRRCPACATSVAPGSAHCAGCGRTPGEALARAIMLPGRPVRQATADGLQPARDRR